MKSNNYYFAKFYALRTDIFPTLGYPMTPTIIADLVVSLK